VADVLVGKHSPGQVTHHLVHVHQNPRSVLGIKGNRLNVWINLAPLLGPIRADLVGSMDKAALERLWPGHVDSHQAERCTDVTRVESRVRRAQQLDVLGRLIGHER